MRWHRVEKVIEAHEGALPPLDVEGAEDIILKRFFTDAPEPLWPKLIIVGASAYPRAFDFARRPVFGVLAPGDEGTAYLRVYDTMRVLRGAA